MYVTADQLAELRILLILGWAAAGALFLIQNWPERQPPPKAVEQCKLHQRPLSECISQHEDPDA